MNLETVNLAVSEGVARIELNRPDKANAMNRQMWQDIRAAFRRVDEMTEARVAVISGRGKYFTSGIGLDMLAGLRQQMQDDCDGRSSERLRRTILDLQDTLSSIERCRKPVIAEIHGACIGGGIDLITCCDMRYAAADAYFSVKEIDVGMTADVGTLQRLPKLVPDGIVRELAYTGRRFDADEAKAMGLVHRVVPAAELEALVLEYCTTIAENAPLTIRASKRIIRELLKSSPAFDAQACTALVRQCFDSQDYIEGRRAFMEKRKPVFKGK